MTATPTPPVPKRTVVHLMRHGEVHNPTGVLYGRLDGYHLSDLGREMAELVTRHLETNDIALVVASPLDRAQQTAAPIAASHGLTVQTDPRVVESENYFEGRQVTTKDLLHPSHWHKLLNPMKPSWGEPYEHIAARMLAAIDDARHAGIDLADVERTGGGHRLAPAADLDDPQPARGPTPLARPSQA